MATRPAGTPQVAVNGVSYQTWLKRKRANPKLKDNTWRGYTSYVAQARNEKAAQRGAAQAQQFGQSYFQIDPNQYMRRYRAMLPPQRAYNPLTDAQLRQQASANVMPFYTQQMDELTKAITERSQKGSAAIQGYTNAYLSTLPAVQQNTANIWQEARNLQSASSGALGDFVRNQGTTLTNELAQAEQAAGQTSAGSAMVSQVGAGSANAAAANDWSTMARLINQGAGAQNYAAQLPAIAGAYGADTMRAFQSDLNEDLSSGLADLRAGASQDIMSMYQGLLDRELTKAGMRDQRAQQMADAYSELVYGNRDAAMAGAAMQAEFNSQAEGYNQDQIAAAQAPPAAAGPKLDPVTGKPVVPKGQQVLQAWAGVRNDVANAVNQILTSSSRPGVAASTNWNALLRQTMAIVRLQMSGFGLTDGQIRGFARQALAANGIYPPGAQGKGQPARGNPGGGGPTPGSRPGKRATAKRDSGTVHGPGRTRIRIPGLPGIDIPGI